MKIQNINNANDPPAIVILTIFIFKNRFFPLKIWILIKLNNIYIILISVAAINIHTAVNLYTLTALMFCNTDDEKLMPATKVRTIDANIPKMVT